MFQTDREIIDEASKLYGCNWREIVAFYENILRSRYILTQKEYEFVTRYISPDSLHPKVTGEQMPSPFLVREK